MIMKKILMFILVTGGFCMQAAANDPLPLLETVKSVDLSRYVGLWYEFGRYPNKFEAPDCTNVTAEYTLRDDGKITVVNTCFLPQKNKIKSVKGKAWVVNKETNAQLKVSFFWPFSGKYWIIGLADDYSWALVGEPKRKFLWILTRTPKIEDATLEQIKKIIVEKGYDPANLIYPLQEQK